MYLFFDTETTGVPLHYNVPIEHQLDTYPHIIQLAYVLCDKDGNVMDTFCSFIKPDGWVVPKEKFWLDKGYSTEKCEELGVPLLPVLEKFITIRKSHPFTVGHNIHFDAGLIRAECLRLKIDVEFKAEKICTMQKSTSFCKLPKPNGKGGYKWPKLEELYFCLFAEKYEDGHDALKDVLATAKCFFELKRLGIITV